MNKFTKHDLSSNEVKLDYNSLFKTAGFAYGALLQELRRYIDDLGCIPQKESSAHYYLTAEYIADTATKLAIAVDTYYALKEGLDREQKEIVNIV